MKPSISDSLVVAGVSSPLAADFASHSLRAGRRINLVARPSILRLVPEQKAAYSAKEFGPNVLGDRESNNVTGIVVFLDSKATPLLVQLLQGLGEFCRTHKVPVVIVSSWRIHLGDRAAATAEALAVRELGGATRVVVFRVGNVLSPHGALSRFLNRCGSWLTLCPGRFRTCFLDSNCLFAAIDRELRGEKPGTVIFALLGANRPWCTLGEDSYRHRRPTIVDAFQCVLDSSCVQTWLLLALGIITRRVGWLRACHVETLHPRTLAELRALYNKYNAVNVKIVGYNNGVNHFGQQFPGQTIVSTCRCAGVVRLVGDYVKVDAGTTIRDVVTGLRRLEKELFVTPNYSYVSIGTSYFVPIHGSASSFSTIGETIDKVILYDPHLDRFVVTRRGQDDFSTWMYNLDAPLLLLRLYVKVKDKSTYYARRQELVNPTSQDIIDQFNDREAANIEMRKASANATTVTVAKYYTRASACDHTLVVPRDSLGSLWDRLEEHRLTSVLFHGLVRHFAYHVELFLTKEEFSRFWSTHTSLPVKKIQLRYLKRDGLPNSPFQHEDRISADLFMLRKHRQPFNRYLRQELRAVPLNRGKHSM
jgi:hypothetical protein